MGTSNIDIDVADEKFKAFAKAFEDHKRAVAALPVAWKEATQSAAAARTEFERSADALAKQSELSTAIDASVAKLTQTSGALAHHWRQMKLNTAGVASNIKEMTSSLTSWAGTLAKVTGMGLGAAAGVAGLGAAGFWGMDRAGQNVMSKRMRARGLGTSIGGVASFETAFGRLGDTGQMLNFSNVAKTDVASAERRALGNIGITSEQIKRLPADELEALAIRKLKEKSDRIKEDTNFYGAMKQLGFGDEHMLNVIRHTSGDELEGLQEKFRTDKPKMDIGEDAAKKWADFAQTVQRVKTTLLNKFETRLAALGKPLSDLSEKLGKLADEFIKKDLGPWIDKLAAGLDYLSTPLGAEQTNKTISAFFDDIKAAAALIGDVVHKLAEVGKWLGVAPASAEPAAATAGGVKASFGSSDSSWFSSAPGISLSRSGGGGGEVSPQRGRFGHRGGGGGGGDVGDVDHSGSVAGSLTALIDSEARKEGVDPRIMEGIRAGESAHSSKYDIKDDSLESSWGPFQLNRKRGLGVEFEKATGLDVRNPSTIPAQVRWVARYLKTHHGNTSPWMGYHGPRDANPKWGESGYRPSPSEPHHDYVGKHDDPVRPRADSRKDGSTPKPDTTPDTPDKTTTNKPKVSIRETPGSNLWAQLNSVNFGRA